MASGDVLHDLDPLHVSPVVAPAAIPDTRNRRRVLDFGAGVDDVARFPIYMPSNYSGLGIHIDLHVMFSSAIAGDSDWESALERLGVSQDADSDSFATAKATVNTTVPGTSGVGQVIRISHSDAEIDGLLVNEDGRLEIKRKGTNDTAAGDAELKRVVISEQ